MEHSFVELIETENNCHFSYLCHIFHTVFNHSSIHLFTQSHISHNVLYLNTWRKVCTSLDYHRSSYLCNIPFHTDLYIHDKWTMYTPPPIPHAQLYISSRRAMWNIQYIYDLSSIFKSSVKPDHVFGWDTSTGFWKWSRGISFQTVLPLQYQCLALSPIWESDVTLDEVINHTYIMRW